MVLFQLGAIIIFTYIFTAEALKYTEAEYKPWVQFCPPITPDPSLNMTWMHSVDYWYIPMWSKRDLMLTVKEVQSEKEFSSQTDSDLQKSCFFYSGFKEKISTVDLHGLNKKLISWTYSNRAMRGGIIDFFKKKGIVIKSEQAIDCIMSSGFNKELCASSFFDCEFLEYEWTTYFVMTDNKNYILGIDEFGDGTREFYLATTSDVVSADQWDKIYKKIESYGFKTSQIYRTNHLCDNDAYVKKVKSGKA